MAQEEYVPCVPTAAGTARIIDRDGDTISAGQEIRELFQNSKDAGAKSVKFTLSEPGRRVGRELLTCIDDGDGFTVDDILRFGQYSEPEFQSDNFGIGAKVSLAKWNPDGIVIVSKNPANTGFTNNTLMAVFKQFPGGYGLYKVDGEFCFQPWEWCGVDFSQLTVLGEKGTHITMMGSTDRPSTFKGSPKSASICSKDRWIASYLQTRYGKFEGVTVVERFHRGKQENILDVPAIGSLQWHTASPTGFENYIFGKDETPGVKDSPHSSIVARGMVSVDGADIRWAVKKEAETGTNGVEQFRLPPGGEMMVIDGEAVEMKAGAPGLALAWGLHRRYGKRLYIAIYPQGDVKMSSSRDRMLTTNGEKLPIEEWRDEWKEPENFPPELRALTEKESPTPDTSDSSEYARGQVTKFDKYFFWKDWKHAKSGTPFSVEYEDTTAARQGDPRPVPRTPISHGTNGIPTTPKPAVSGKTTIPLSRRNTHFHKPVQALFANTLDGEEDDGTTWASFAANDNTVELNRSFKLFRTHIMALCQDVEGPSDAASVVTKCAEGVYIEHMVYKVSHYLGDHKTVGVNELNETNAKVLNAMFYGVIPERRQIAARLPKGYKLSV